MTTVDIDLGAYQLGWSDEEDYVYKPEKGLDEQISRDMSLMKKEPEWILEFRLKAFRRFVRKPMPDWVGGGALDEIDFDDIYYYIKPTEGQAEDWDMVPESIKETYEKLGIPLREQEILAGVQNVAVDAVFDSVSVATTFKEKLSEAGVIFCSFSEAVQEHPELVKKYIEDPSELFLEF